MRPRTVFLVISADDETLLRLGLWTLTAASVGDDVDVLLTAPALRRWLDGSFDVASGASATARARTGLPPPSALVSQAKELASVRVVSCDTELALAGVSEAEAKGRLDALVSLPSFWRESAAARLVRL